MKSSTQCWPLEWLVLQSGINGLARYVEPKVQSFPCYYGVSLLTWFDHRGNSCCRPNLLWPRLCSEFQNWNSLKVPFTNQLCLKQRCTLFELKEYVIYADLSNHNAALVMPPVMKDDTQTLILRIACTTKWEQWVSEVCWAESQSFQSFGGSMLYMQTYEWSSEAWRRKIYQALDTNNWTDAATSNFLLLQLHT